MKIYNFLLKIFISIILIFPGVATSQSYPSKAIQMVVPFPPGGSTDIMARVLSSYLQKALKQPVVVQNRSGAGGVVGTDVVARADADGYTILLSSSAPLAVGLSLNSSIKYNVEKDFDAVSMIGEVPLVLVVNPKFNVNSISEFLDYAKNNPNKLTIALNALGSQSHLITELLQHRTNTNFNMIPYKGSGPAVVDLLAGIVQADIENLPVVINHIKSGDLKAIAIFSEERDKRLPNVPTMKELGYEEFIVSPWFALVTPSGTDQNIIKLLNKNINEALSSDEIKKAFENQGASPVIKNPEQTRVFIQEEIKKWADVVKETKATLK